jgi:hypothetical protein
MATKKIVISDEPEEVEESPAEPEHEAAVDESTPDADSSADTSAEAEQPTENPAPDTPESAAEAPQTPPHQGPNFGTLKPKKVMVGRKTLIAGAVVVVLVAGGYVFNNSKYTDPLPTSVTNQISFKVYYPQSSDKEYALAPQSASYADGKLSYTVTLKNNHSEGASPFVRVSETAIVGKGPDVTHLPNFKVFNASAGKAAVSPNGQVMNGVLVTNKTLVILNGLGGVTQDQLMQIIKSM